MVLVTASKLNRDQSSSLLARATSSWSCCCSLTHSSFDALHTASAFASLASHGSTQLGVELGYDGLLVLMLVFEVGDHHSLVVESDVHRELFVLRLFQAIFVLLVHRLELDVGRL